MGQIVHNLPERRLLIGGVWADAASGKTFTTINPATEAVITHIAEAGAADVDRAVKAARNALEHGAWRRMTGAERGHLLRRLAALVGEDRENLVALEALDAGKPLAATRRQDMPAAIDCLEYYAGWADKITGEVIPARSDALTYVTREPTGVVAAIVPWNFPLMNAVWKIAPALACGCTVVLKPAELTPLSALRLGELALEAGFPAGVLNILPGFGPVAGQALIEHPGVDKISFTGSPQVGRHIMATAAQQCKRVTLELGGKSPNVVFADADLDAAAHAAGSGIFFNAGQVCSAGSRILVQSSKYAEFVDRLVARAQRIRLGDPFSPETSMGPLISRVQLERVQGHLVRSLEGGLAPEIMALRSKSHSRARGQPRHTRACLAHARTIRRMRLYVIGSHRSRDMTRWHAGRSGCSLGTNQGRWPSEMRIMRKSLKVVVCALLGVAGMLVLLSLPADARRGGGGGGARMHAHAGGIARGRHVSVNRSYARNVNRNVNRNVARVNVNPNVNVNRNVNRRYVQRNGRWGYWRNGLWVAAPLAAGAGYVAATCTYEYNRWKNTGSSYWRDRYYQCAG